MPQRSRLFYFFSLFFVRLIHHICSQVITFTSRDCRRRRNRIVNNSTFSRTKERMNGNAHETRWKEVKETFTGSEFESEPFAIDGDWCQLETVDSASVSLIAPYLCKFLETFVVDVWLRNRRKNSHWRTSSSFCFPSLKCVIADHKYLFIICALIEAGTVSTYEIRGEGFRSVKFKVRCIEMEFFRVMIRRDFNKKSEEIEKKYSLTW